MFSALPRLTPASKLDLDHHISLYWPLGVGFTARAPAFFPAKTIGNTSEAGEFLRNIRHERKHLISNVLGMTSLRSNKQLQLPRQGTGKIPGSLITTLPAYITLVPSPPCKDGHST
jgi:hypothetical protein